MKRLLVSTLFLFTLSLNAPAQTEEARPLPTPTKVDSFGDVLATEWLARLHNFTIEIQSTPLDRVWIVAFANKNKLPGWPHRRALWARSYLIKARGVAPERIEVVNGGFRQDTEFELWLVPFGAEEPIAPLDFSLAMAGERAPILFDRFFVFEPQPLSDYDGSYGGYFQPADRHLPLTSYLRADPALRAHVIAYSERRDRRGTDRRLASKEKRSIILTSGLGPERVSAVGGGRREHKTVEVWLVPPGSPLPTSTPETARGRARRRR